VLGVGQSWRQQLRRRARRIYSLDQMKQASWSVELSLGD
jgi:hypothetical protein